MPRAQVRTRKGCLTCRKRRRKCDEQKPQCQNCTKRGTACRYGVNLTFLSANLFNLEPDDAQALQKITPSRYGHIRFVDGSDDTERVTGNDSEQHTSRPTSEHSLHRLLETADADHNHTVQSLPGSPAGFLSRPQTSFHEQYYHDDDNETILRQDVAENDNERQNETLVVYPLVLVHGTENQTGDAEETVPPVRGVGFNREIVAHSPQRLSLPVMSPNSSPSTDMSQNRNWLPLAKRVTENARSVLQSEKPLDQQFLVDHQQPGLLKFYVDEVAPWLDICTPQNSFGIHIPIMAREYTPLLDAVVALAARQQSQTMPPENSKASQNAELVKLASASIASDIYSSRDEAIAACTLLVITELLSTQIQQWRVVLKSRIDFHTSLGIDGFSDGHRGSVSWVLLRLDLALAIFSGTPIMIPTEKWHPISTPFSDDSLLTSLEQSRIHEWTRRSILLCGQAAQFCFSGDICNITTIQSAADTWTYLWSLSQSWLKSLPSSMHPIFTSPISAIPSAPPYFFPCIIYTSRSNMYAAVMHHTTSILLLQMKPCGTRPSSHLKTPTWHAVQLCGICLGNNANWSYDPTILAALIYAGRLISYHEQKKELLEFLQVQHKASGWQVGGAINDLLDLWRSDSAFEATSHGSSFQ